MKNNNLILKPFDFQNLSFLLDVVVSLWSPSLGDEFFKRFNVEYIIRNNIWENDFRFELLDENQKFLAAAFFARKGDECNAQNWFLNESKRFPLDFLVASKMSKTFLDFMDEKTFALMNDDDIKLSLFISKERGAGCEILERTLKMLSAQGWKNLFLWTDCECNWQWYFKHGFTLVCEEVYKPFCCENEDYKTYIFKRRLM